MSLESINPATGETLERYTPWDAQQLDGALQAVARAAPEWQTTGLGERAGLMRQAARVLRQGIEDYAGLMTREMGKPIREARAEVEKCALVCDYYAEHAEGFLADEVVATDAGRSLVAHLPLGTVLAVMPWNFPFWQVFRFAAPGLMAGNTGVLKHAANVTGCAFAIESVFREAGFPPDAFRTLPITTAQVASVIAHPAVHAVTLTGSEPAGRAVAAAAGQHLKKSLLELGGSDAFIVLEDADLEAAARTAVASRFVNGGQSCIAAKRFILVDEVADAFLERFRAATQALRQGDPLDPDTDIGPMARTDLRDELHQQVRDSIARGALPVIGCEPLAGPGSYYKPSILDRVSPGMPAWDQELFGPVAAVIRVADEEQALGVANGSRFGLGGSVWTQDRGRGERLARRMESGATFVNAMVKSDPRLPFGGIKASGYGRELSVHGIREFVNVKTLWID